jgi:serine phosphatase RsbU (regulator of sigma subunit)
VTDPIQNTKDQRLHRILALTDAGLVGMDVGELFAELLGGDWFDVFGLPSGHLGAVIGDVSGHGLRAAVVLGRLRSALRAYALDADDPAEVLTRLDRKIPHFEAGSLATIIYAMVIRAATRWRSRARDTSRR